MIKNNILLADITYSFSTNSIIRNNIVGATTFTLLTLLKIALVTEYFYSSNSIKSWELLDTNFSSIDVVIGATTFALMA